ncbi:unnamed protein product, partial [Effrenium voratum]
AGGCQPEAGGARAGEFGEKRTCFELFASTGFWETRHKDDLVIVVSDILRRLMMPFDGWDAVPPELLNDLSFGNAVMAGLAGGNRLPALEGDRGRDKILFSDGVLLNLPDLSQRKDNEGRKVIESFQQLASDGCELVTLLRRYGAYDWVLWLLRFFTRDVLLLILLRFLGREDNNYGTMLPGSYVVVDFLKAYEQGGAPPITGRRCHGHARSFVLQGILCMTSNFPLRVKTHEDEGWSRRARILQAEARFVANPKLLTEHRCDDTLKARIAKGMFSPRLLFFVSRRTGDRDDRPLATTTSLP